MKQPDLITIVVSGSKEIRADKVDMMVTIKGTSLFTGNQAFEKAAEINNLVKDLREFGLPEKSIFLEGVYAKESKGLLGKFSSAIYALRITCDNLDNLAEILGILTSQNNLTLGTLEWKYSNIEQSRDELLESCIQKSKTKAEKVASKLDVKILGIYEFKEVPDGSGLGMPKHLKKYTAFASTEVAKLDKNILGLPVSHTKKINLAPNVKYRISAF
jgi:uncharacterized protein YggE